MITNSYFNGQQTNQLTRSYGVKSVNWANVRKWFFAGAAAATAITGGVAAIHKICKDCRKRRDDVRKEEARLKEKAEDREYQERQEKERRDYQEVQKKENREYQQQVDKERREFYARQRMEEHQARAEEREKNRQFKYAMKQFGVHSPIQPTPAKRETGVELGQKEVPNVEEMRLIGSVIHSGERGIIFGATGQCKSILAWDFGINLALGESCCLFPSIPTKHAPIQVYILDGEMNDANVLTRYSKELLSRLSNLHRISNIEPGYENLIAQVKNIVENIKNREVVIIIDNLTALCPNATAKQVSLLYNALKSIGEQANARGTKVTEIVVAHERKNRSCRNLQDISIDNMYGTSYMGDFADFAIGIAETADPAIKRIKVVKTRLEADYENVIIARKEAKPYLHLEFVKETSEEEALTMNVNNLLPEHLQQGDITLEVAMKMKALYKPGVNGHGLNAIGRKFGVSGTAVKKAFRRYNLL